MVRQRFGCVRKEPVLLLDKASKSLKLKNGQIAVQSLDSGETAIVKRSQIKKVSFRHPEKKNKC